MNSQIKVTAKAGLLVCVCAAFGCKKPASTTSSVQSLDNFAAKASGGEETLNDCGVRLTADKVAVNSEIFQIEAAMLGAPNTETKLQAAGTIIALPKAMRNVIFNSNRAKIRFVKPAQMQAECPSLTAAEKNFLGGGAGPDVCWPIDKKDGHLEILIPLTNPTAIHHGLIRAFAYIYSQVGDGLGKLQTSDAQIQSWLQAASKQLKDQRRVLASAFLADLSKSNQTAWQRLMAMDNQSPQTFENFVFAESVDSYYCSAKTQSSFAKQFPQTYSAFTHSTKMANSQVPPLLADLGPAIFNK